MPIIVESEYELFCEQDNESEAHVIPNNLTR